MRRVKKIPITKAMRDKWHRQDIQLEKEYRKSLIAEYVRLLDLLSPSLPFRPHYERKARQIWEQLTPQEQAIVMKKTSQPKHHRQTR